MKFNIKKIIFIGAGFLACLSSQVVAAESVWKERWIFGYSGKSGGDASPSNESGVEATYEFDSGVFLNGIYHKSKEVNGGYDNNGVNSHSNLIGLGYAFNIGDSNKVKIGYLRHKLYYKNIQMGGARVGTYLDGDIDGDGPMLQLVHKITPDLTADFQLFRSSYSTGDTINHKRIGGSYNITPSFFGRFEYQLVDRSGWHGNYWHVGVGYQF